MKSININELQSQISKIIKSVEKGEDFEVIRYSKPVAVVIGSKKWEKLQVELNELKGSCRKCVDEFKKTKSRMIPNVTRISRISKKY
ncbi:MAG: type II toxin-antitoxin system Phd/YefM family antitoxin [Patescibacteria group bacterium]|nr:type II toxin-antitoxin system Phd/YefM family antitoxin [Patescibacteria group bacterium]